MAPHLSRAVPCGDLVFGAVRPARSLVISALVAPEALVEIEAIAERAPA